jgi:polyvinyl alcohol dehydrogenase (cytochrome)
MRLQTWIFVSSIVMAPGALAQEIAERPASTRSAATAAAVVAHGETLFKARCASCHDPAVDRAPPKVALARRFPDDIATALKTGVMQPMAARLSDEDIHAIATYLGADGMTEQAGDPPVCSSSGRFSLSGPGWNGWSIDARNSRFQPDPGLSSAKVSRLKVKWSMTYTGGRYGQPIIVGGRLFLTSSSGRIYSLDAKTGCMHWRFDADAGVRTTPMIGQLKGAAPSGYLMYFGDFQRNVYALDAASGKLQWKMNIEKHPRSVLTGAPVLYQGLLYVPLSSWEETAGGVGSYGCCTARGGLAALDAKDGKLVWKTYAIEQEPQPTAKNAAGTQMYGPAGAAVWSAPTIDAKRHLVYIGTGDSYTDVKENGSDAIMALDLASGKVKWRNQVTENDSFLMGCNRGGTNCPTVLGPDHDFGPSCSPCPTARTSFSRVRNRASHLGWTRTTMARRSGATKWAMAGRWAASSGAWPRMPSDCTLRSRTSVCRRRRARPDCLRWILPPAINSGTPRPRRCRAATVADAFLANPRHPP